MNTPKISVIVPIYNVEKYVKKCLDSILFQTFSDFEVILVNDCSPDNSEAICEEYAIKDSRFKLVNKPQNEGLPQARKTGFENSTGEYIINIDSDDWVEPTILEQLYNVAVNENADLVCCDFFREFPDKCEVVEYIIDTNNRFNNLGFTLYSAIWCYLFRRDIYEKIEFPLYSMAEDVVISQQALFYSKKLCKISAPLYHYRVNPNAMTQNKTMESFLEHQKNLLWTIDFLKTNLQNDFALIEKNVNILINKFKYIVLKNRKIRKNKDLYKFYPGSGLLWFIIRNKWFKGLF